MKRTTLFRNISASFKDYVYLIENKRNNLCSFHFMLLWRIKDFIHLLWYKEKPHNIIMLNCKTQCKIIMENNPFYCVRFHCMIQNYFPGIYVHVDTWSSRIFNRYSIILVKILLILHTNKAFIVKIPKAYFHSGIKTQCTSIAIAMIYLISYLVQNAFHLLIFDNIPK